MGTITNTGTATVYPSSYDSSDYKYYSASGLTNAYGSSTNSSYATINLTRGSRAITYLYYGFNLSSIPENATINSVTCAAKILVSQTSTSYIATRELQLFTGTTAKGSATSVTSTSATSYNLTCGTWTRAELQNARIRLYAVRGTSSTSSTFYYCFYGATLTVTYTWYQTTYTVTVSNNASKSVTPTSQEIVEGNSATVQVSETTGLTILDNDVDVTSQFVLNSGVYKYTISNVRANHSIVVTAAVYFKNGSSWTRAKIVWKKTNGTWVRQLSQTSLIDTAVAPYMEFPFCNNSLTENQLILSDNKKLVKGN